MKQYVYSFVLVVAALIAAPTQIFAQCVPLDSIPGDAIIDPLPFTEDNPDSGIRDTACVGEDFITVFNIEVPDEVAIPPFGTLPIDEIEITDQGIDGLPAGLDFTTTPSNGIFLPNTVGCLEITGVPTEEGEFILTLNVIIRSGGFEFPFSLPDGELVSGEYRLVVRENGNPSCQPSSVTETVNADFSLNVFPNPATDRLNVNFTAARKGATQLSLVDIHGRVVLTNLIDSQAGTNNVMLDTAELPAGFYTLLLNDAADGLRSGVSSRVIINQ
ncbi:hypothetical protein CEQ90_19420 [Lewinellaceae bacterium SD302]|nr:hypothetical protein CEQ90_19420 [Lewinellaceae bacterium SD302]